MAVKQFVMKKHVGPHHMWADGKERMLMPGDMIEIEETLLGNVLDKFDVIAESKDPEPEEPKELRKEVRERKTGGGYDVINAVTREPFNDVPLSRPKAYEMAGIPDPGEEMEKDKGVKKPKAYEMAGTPDPGEETEKDKGVKKPKPKESEKDK